MKRLTFFLAAAFFTSHFLFAAVNVHGAATLDTVQSLSAKLEAWNVEEVWPEVQEALSREPQNADLLEAASHIAFHRGDYGESSRLIKKSMELGGDEERRKAFGLFVEETINVLAPYKIHETAHFRIHLDESRDGVLVEYLADALEKTHKVIAQQYGFIPKEKVRVELFPDTKAFYLASTLSVRDIEVTGAVGLTKFNKLQFLSPRALAHGYRWLDAISHEYMHYLIVKQTANKAPIWFHEGLSKYEETRWRNGPGYLSSPYRTLLARAEAEKKLIGFERMEPSLVYLETPEEVQLAYAQAASAIEFIVDRAGREGLRRIMERMSQAETKGAGDSIREVMGLEFAEFEAKWKEYLATKELKPVAGTSIHRYKVREEQADEERMDLEEITSQVARNRARLGDRLRERGRPGAAVLEYRRALAELRDSVPIMNRLCSALMELGMNEEVLDLSKQIQGLAPDHPTPYTRLGQVYLKLKDYERAQEAFEESLQINPFNPEVHLGLAEAYAMLGKNLSAGKEREIAYKLGRIWR